MRPASRTRRTGFLLFAAMTATACMGLLVAFAPLPRPLLMIIAERTAPWTLTDYEGTGLTGRPPHRGFRSLVGRYLDYQLAHLAWSEYHPRESVPAPQRLLETLVPLRRLYLNQAEIPHAPLSWAVPLSGVGYCDQLNAFAAMVLAHEFGRAELGAVTALGSGHTYGRVWWRARSEWLYFDFWPDDVVVFTIGADGHVQALARASGRPGLAGVPELFRALYAQAPRAVIFAGFPATFGGYLFLKTFHRYPPAAAEITAGTIGPATAGVAPSAQPVSSPDQARAYAAARVAAVAGDQAAARRGYEKVIQMAGTRPSLLAQAAVAFLNARPRTP